LELSGLKPTGVIEISQGVNLDVTENDEITGVEILNASKKLPLKTLFTFEYDNQLL